jgi:hypothetical protein
MPTRTRLMVPLLLLLFNPLPVLELEPGLLLALGLSSSLVLALRTLIALSDVADSTVASALVQSSHKSEMEDVGLAMRSPTTMLRKHFRDDDWEGEGLCTCEPLNVSSNCLEASLSRYQMDEPIYHQYPSYCSRTSFTSHSSLEILRMSTERCNWSVLSCNTFRLFQLDMMRMHCCGYRHYLLVSLPPRIANVRP